MDDEEFELPEWAETGEDPPFENRVHDELIEGFAPARRGATRAGDSGREKFGREIELRAPEA